MGRMIRKQIYIEPHQDEVLKRRAKELGITEAELIRRSINQMNHVPVRPPRDHKAWQEVEAFIRQKCMMKVPQTGRPWTREELYDERLKR